MACFHPPGVTCDNCRTLYYLQTPTVTSTPSLIVPIVEYDKLIQQRHALSEENEKLMAVVKAFDKLKVLRATVFEDTPEFRVHLQEDAWDAATKLLKDLWHNPSKS